MTIRPRHFLLLAAAILALAAFRIENEPTRWEVTVLAELPQKKVQPIADSLGAEGWELTTCLQPMTPYHFVCFFKRPVP